MVLSISFLSFWQQTMASSCLERKHERCFCALQNKATGKWCVGVIKRSRKMRIFEHFLRHEIVLYISTIALIRHSVVRNIIKGFMLKEILASSGIGFVFTKANFRSLFRSAEVQLTPLADPSRPPAVRFVYNPTYP